MKSIGIFGSSLPLDGSAEYEQARQVGREIARAGGRVVCGGYGGVMEAACRGASESGGRSLGIVLAGRGEPNSWVSETIAVGSLAQRLTRLRDACDAWICLPRGLGTMLEIVWIAESLVKEDASPRPLVMIGDFWRPVVEIALAEASSRSGAVTLRSCLHFADGASQAVRLAVG